MRLATLDSVQKLQMALRAKAKESPGFRFYSLYDKIYRKDVLWTAWRRCLINDGAPGVDGQTFGEIEAYGVMKWLAELTEELRTNESFDFLGYTFGRRYAPRTGQPYIGAGPSKKKIARLRRSISEQTSARWGLAEPEEIVGRLNLMLRGWANYFSYGSVSRAYRAVDYHTRERLRQWLCRKHKVPGRGTARYPLQYGYKDLGLIELRCKRRRFPRANA